MILKLVLQGNLVLSRLSSSTSRQPAQRCPLVDRAAAEERQRTAEQAAPQCDLCKSGNVSPYAEFLLQSVCKLSETICFLFSDALQPGGKSALWISDVLSCFYIPQSRVLISFTTRT